MACYQTCNQALLHIWFSLEFSCFYVERLNISSGVDHDHITPSESIKHCCTLLNTLLWLHFSRSPCRHGQGTRRSALGFGASFLWWQHQCWWSKNRKFGRPEQQASVSVCSLCACVCVCCPSLYLFYMHISPHLFFSSSTFISQDICHTRPFKGGCLLLNVFLFSVCVFNLD